MGVVELSEQIPCRDVDPNGTFVLYFFNTAGHYQSRIYRHSRLDAVTIVFQYKHVVPRIMVTQMDEVVLETDGPVIVASVIPSAALLRFSAFHGPSTETVTVDTVRDYNEHVRAFKQLPDPLAPSNQAALREAEVKALVFGAARGVNLYEYGYVPAETVITEIEERASLS